MPMFVVLFAAFAMALRDRTASDDIAIVTPVANRVAPHTEDLVGKFTNSVLLRLDCTASRPFADLLRDASSVILGALCHQETPIRNVIKACCHADVAFNIVFGLQNFPATDFVGEGLTMEVLDVDFGFGLTDLTMLLCDDKNGIRAQVYFNRKRFG